MANTFRFCLLALPVFAFAVACAFAQPDLFDGRWDLTLKSSDGATFPSWLEVRGARDGPEVRVVERTGSVHRATAVKLENAHLSFQSGAGVSWDLTADQVQLAGTETRGSHVARVTGIRAPVLDRKPPRDWSSPEALFNGTNLAGWSADNPSQNHWRAHHGTLLNAAPGANLRTERQFNDFRLHIEFNCPRNGNSGIYLRGRYEVQVEYEPGGVDDALHSIGSIYGFLAPQPSMPPQPGQWESFDITLVGRTVSVVRDGQLTISSQEIPGITGGALNSHEADPGPLYLQGDHTGGIRYRNIKISTPRP